MENLDANVAVTIPMQEAVSTNRFEDVETDLAIENDAHPENR